ncbi:MAG: hypothetical protein Kow0029_09760 [Candidatus Rifleibacteriota bacterium]
MHRGKSLKALLLVMVFSFVMVVQSAQAGIISDIKLWLSEKANIRQHSKVITNEVKTLYRERNAIKDFAEGASTLVKAYKSISNKNLKANFPQLLEIARAITQVVSGYQKLAPKAEAMYRRAKPSMQYFANLADQTNTLQTAKNKIMVKGFSNDRLNRLAGAHGWSRVFETIKSNPLNLFRWGKLSDEYKMGKIEAQYPLKCAQIAFEATAYYAAAKQSVSELIGIKKEIEGIMGGDLSAILNIGSTVNKIQSVGGTAESLGELAEKGANLMNTRFNELLKIQEEYVAANKAYNQKYNKTPTGSNTTTTSSGSYASSPESSVITTGGITGKTANVSLQQAMANYQKAYETYIKISQSGSADTNTLNEAIRNLQIAKKQVEQAKARAR